MTVMEARSVGARKWWALAGLSLGVLAVGLDATVLSVALPTLAVSLHASATDLQWFVSAYTLGLAVGLLPGGMLGDRFGRKRVMLITLAVFGTGSLACAYAPNAAAFIAARTVLGVSAGFMLPLGMWPDSLRQVVVLLPFAAMVSIPIDVILGKLHGVDLLAALALPALWAIVMLGLGRLVLGAALRKLVVQGG